jgi:Mg-chelatase subunit ChlD
MTFSPKFNPSTSGNSLAAKIAKARAEEATKKENAIQATVKLIEQTKTAFEYVPAAQIKEKIRIIFDDSCSMSGPKIDDARLGTIEFMRNCIPNEVAVAVHPLEYRKEPSLSILTTDLPSLSTKVKTIPVTGSTPLYSTMIEVYNAEPKLTRGIIFSDGAPDLSAVESAEVSIAFFAEAKIPVDTVLIATGTPSPQSREYLCLKEIADKTGGYFLVFDRNKMDFKKAFKYLAPGLRLRLADGSARKALEEGRLI